MAMYDEGTHDRKRLRQIHRFAAAGVLLGVVAAVASALLGVSGTAGAAIFFVVTAFGCVVAALVGFGYAIVDEVRRLPVALKRIGVAVLYFALAAVFIVASVGAASGINLGG